MSKLPKSFQSFALSPMLEEAIVNLKFENPTDIQKNSIPVALNGKDIVASAQTGTGKTAAFCLPVIENLLHSTDKMALILVPTREIGIQIRDFVNQLTEKDTSFNTALVIGGEPLKRQEKALANKPRMIIASPGRLVDLLERKLVDLSKIQYLVLDEADRMLDMGFIPQLNQIVTQLPFKRQTLLFSATINDETLSLAKAYTRKAQFIEVGKPKSAPQNLTKKELQTTKEMKFDNLLDELNSRTGSVLIFSTTKAEVEFLYEELAAYAYKVQRIHGDRTQSQRNSAIKGLKNGDTRILVATDVAARGVDIPAIEFVFNYEPPQMAEDYIHRIGRTARAGASGEVLNFITPENKDHWERTYNQKDSTQKDSSRKKKAPGKKKTKFEYRGKTKAKAKSKSKTRSKSSHSKKTSSSKKVSKKKRR